MFVAKAEVIRDMSAAHILLAVVLMALGFGLGGNRVAAPGHSRRWDGPVIRLLGQRRARTLLRQVLAPIFLTAGAGVAVLWAGGLIG